VNTGLPVVPGTGQLAAGPPGEQDVVVGGEQEVPSGASERSSPRSGRALVLTQAHAAVRLFSVARLMFPPTAHALG
jgi:hypothetical protein